MPTLAQGWIDMNERIRELESQCWEATSWQAQQYGRPWFNSEKFAELIVRECADIAKKVDGDESDDYQSGRTWAGIDVLKHFGVEE